MFKVAVYGKGGIGKSTISANLSYLLSKDGSSVLHVGCDPKHDSTRLLMHGESIRTFSDDTAADPVRIGINNISCVECGGADPGKGCAGKGMELLFDRISGVDADYRVFDVLGDVVCGGFSIPARAGNSDRILIVTSGEFMSIYAANNILKGLENINPGESVLGIVFNRRGDKDEEFIVRRFSEATGIPIVCDIPRSDLFRQAEAEGEVLSSLFPDSKEAEVLRGLCETVREHSKAYRPRALSEEAMMDLAAGREIRDNSRPQRKKTCTFDGFDAERNLSYVGDYVMPACTSHGAADGAMKIRDAAAIMHGPRNCAYLMEYAFRRRILNTSGERSGDLPSPGLYSTNLDADEAFRDSGVIIEDAVLRAKSDGYYHMFLISTCSVEIMGTDMFKIAQELSAKHSVDIIPVAADTAFLSSKFGGTYGLMDALISRMKPREVEKGTVNLVARWFYGVGKDRNMEAIDHILSTLGLRVRFKFLDFCTMSEIEDFCSAQYDIQLGITKLNKRFGERISEVTGRRLPLELEVPVGLYECLDWIHGITAYAPELSHLVPEAERLLRGEFDSYVSKYRPYLQGKKAVIYCVMVRDLKWQVDALQALGMEVRAVMFVNGFVIDHNVKIPDYGDVEVMNDMTMCDLRRIMAEGDIDIVVTNDSDRVARAGFRWAPMSSRYFGMDGVEEWMQIITDCLRMKSADWERGL